MSNDARSKSKQGLMVLSARTLTINVLQVASVFALSRWLTPGDYGLFALLNGWIGTALFFTDLGVAGALLQKNEDPTREQLASCAGLQLFLGLLLAAIVWVASALFREKYDLSSEAVWMLRTLALVLPIYALRAVPRLLIERNLNFVNVAKVDVTEATASYLVQIGAAAASAGAWSFVAASLTKVVLGSVMFVRHQIRHEAGFVWPALSFRVLRPLLRFGLPFQANAIVVALRGLMIPLVLAPLLSVDQIGLITWSMGLVSIPMVLAVNYNQVLFASLSRLQKNTSELIEFASRSTAIAVLGFGFVFGLGGASSASLIDLLFSSKWHGAKELLPVAALAVGLSTLRYLCGCLMNATGTPQVRFKIESAVVVMEAAAAWVSISMFGLNGYLWSLAAVNFIGLIASVLAVKKFLNRAAVLRFVLVPGAGLLAYVVGSGLHLHANLVFAAASFIVSFFVICRLIDPRATRDAITLVAGVLNRLGRRKSA